MRSKNLIIMLILASSLFVYNCSEIQDEIAQPPILEGVHKGSTLDPSAPEFHGNLVGDKGFAPCQQCHDANFTGGITNVNCVECHSSISVHKEGIVSEPSPNFHPKFLANNNLPMAECKDCHGNDFSGSTSSPSCTGCHSGISVHQEGIIEKESDNFHGNFIKNHNWALDECSQCHGADYSGGLISISCNTCHTSSSGPEACNTCHGVFTDETRIAPPKDLNDNIETSEKGVGTHTKHLFETSISKNIPCEECHTVPSDFNSPGHIDDSPGAEVIFGTLASMGPSKPIYNSEALTCSNTYCHGNFSFSKEESDYPHAYTEPTMVGNNFSPLWTKVDGTQAVCGTCHGEIDEAGNLITPQPKGHFSSFTTSDCVLCHSTAFNADGSLNKDTHMNGEKNLN